MKLKRWLVRLAALSALTLTLIAVCHWRVAVAASGRLYDEAAAVPGGRVALVLGCAKKLRGGWSNPFFTSRIRAAAELFEAGKAHTLLVSGDNRHEGYDEPTDMKEALIAAGVPEDRIVCDYAGFRTLDSVVRAKKVFGATEVTIISQRFHNERAVYLARCSGMDAIALNAQDVRLEWALKVYLREALARVKAVLDVQVLHTQPHFLGEPVKLPERPTGPDS